MRVIQITFLPTNRVTYFVRFDDLGSLTVSTHLGIARHFIEDGFADLAFDNVKNHMLCLYGSKIYTEDYSLELVAPSEPHSDCPY